MKMKWFMKSMFCVLILTGCIAISWVTGAQAQESKDQPKAGVFNLGEVVVTGKGEIVTQMTTVETVDRGQMDLTNAIDVSKAIDTLPGVFVTKGRRNEAFLNVRGFSQRYIPIFYDGIPLYVPWDGYADPSELPTGNISQITVTKGAASVLYGPNTMAGVINIVSMKPQKAIEGSYSVELNENGPFYGLNLGSKIDRFYVMAGLTGFHFGDFKMSDDFTQQPRGTAGYSEDGGTRDNSDAESSAGNFKVGFMPADGHEYALGVQHVHSEKGLPTNIYPSETQSFWRFTEWEKTTYYFIGDSKITDHLSAQTRIYYDTYYNVLDAYDNNTYTTQTRPPGSGNPPFTHSTYDDYTTGGSLALRSTHFSKNTLSFAFHYRDDVHRQQRIDGTSPWDRYEGETFSYGLEDDIKITEKLGLVAGLDYDVQKAKEANGAPLRPDDDVLNGMGGLVYNFEDATKAHFSVAKKSRFPTLNEAYSTSVKPATGELFIPNPNLKKETSINYEAGVERPLPWHSNASLAIFYSDVNDKIASVRTPSGTSIYDNVGKAVYQGFELSLKTEGLPHNTLETHYTYLDAEDRSDNRTSDHLRESPEHQFYLSDLYKLNDWLSLFGKAQYNAGQWDQKRDLTWLKLGSYWTVDLKAMVEIYKNLVAEIGVQNMFDENYETAYGFPREGRTFFCGVRGAF
jgi:iron complex outermembrane recepter protein